MKLTPGSYKLVQDELLECAQHLAALPLDDLIIDAEQSDNIAYFIDPTLWMVGHDPLRAIRELAQLASALGHAFVERRELLGLALAATQRGHRDG